MCGILAILDSKCDEAHLVDKAVNLSKLIRHRGPDWNGVHVQRHGNLTSVLAHERLAIVDVMSGHQPLFNHDKTICASINGEIYNHMELRNHLSKEMLDSFESQSDCQVIPYIYQKLPNFVEKLDGMFAFVISDETTQQYMAARDPIGICPLYVGYHTDGSMWFASEMKSLTRDCSRVEVFPPGHLYSSSINKGKGGFVRYYCPSWWDVQSPLPTGKLDLGRIRNALEAAVEKRLMADVPFGVLLSGGVDSSLIAAIVQKKLSDSAAKSPTSRGGGSSRLRSFSIGLKGSPDLVAARSVAAFLGTKHYEFTFEMKEGIDAIRDVIYHTETYDVTTIRAATPMYFLARRVKSLGIKMVLSGEGADEIFGGYLYFHKAPNKEEFHRETQRKIHSLHQYDVLRANKSTMAFGVEARVPFLDKVFFRHRL
eukprot:GHVS01049743.1.p1 GENE.GHVS01049743.1~~GHVS01049743.1.p1  ORF type:complete len:426 (-),score=34.89 GHVS01049743.1:810-2087(-)